MALRTRIIGLLSTTVGLASAASAQYASRQIRFITTGVEGEHQWQGYVERLTSDSLQLRVRGTDTIASFSRRTVRSVERERLGNPGSAALFGCATVGGALGALGYVGAHDPDARGLDTVVGLLGFGVGCGVGAAGGLAVSAVRSRGWEPWFLPDSLPPTARPKAG